LKLGGEVMSLRMIAGRPKIERHKGNGDKKKKERAT